MIPGTGPEEVLTLGHTSEQGAEDNATGVAATLEAMATLNRLIAAGTLPKPKRSIRVLSMGEMYGSMHYVAAQSGADPANRRGDVRGYAGGILRSCRTPNTPST